MSETTWRSLPTHSGWWWRRGHELADVPILVGDIADHWFEYRLYIGGRFLVQEEHPGYSYCPIPDPPPADAAKLPRRFLVKQPSRWIMGCYFPYEDRMVRVTEHGEMDSWIGGSPSDHAAEIEWIDP